MDDECQEVETMEATLEVFAFCGASEEDSGSICVLSLETHALLYEK